MLCKLASYTSRHDHLSPVSLRPFVARHHEAPEVRSQPCRSARHSDAQQVVCERDNEGKKKKD